MNRALKTFLFTTIFITGVVSLLASSPGPSGRLTVTTLNNFDGRIGDVVYACQDETVNLAWKSYTGTPLALSAKPPGNLQPALNLRRVAPEGEGDFAVLGRTDLTLTADDERPDDEVEIKVLPETLCTGFGFPLIGWYSGALTQTAPTAETFAREVRLLVAGGKPSTLTLIMGTDTSLDYRGYPDELWSTCNLSAADSTLRCAFRSEMGSSFELEAHITETGLVGRYSGTTAAVDSVIPFEGTLNFEKQAGIPPEEGAGSR